MDPIAQHTALEAWDDEGKPFLQEYKGSGKLKVCLLQEIVLLLVVETSSFAGKGGNHYWWRQASG